MRRIDKLEPDKIMARLEQKFQRKTKAEAQRKETRRIRTVYSGFSGRHWESVYGNFPEQY